MKNEAILREIFIENTIRLVAEGGFEAATTRAIAGERREIENIRINEAYIYRIFSTKEHLFAEVFAMLDCELLALVTQALEESDHEADSQKRWDYLFMKLWNFLSLDENKCKYYIRYYYSVYFRGESLRAHNAKFRDFIYDMTPLFTENADVCAILQHVINVILSFAMSVHNGSIMDTDHNLPHIFNVIYSSILPYLR